MRRPIILKKMTPLIIAVSIIILSSCHLRTVYYQYHSTPVQGWEKNDTLLFDVPPMAEAGNYHSILRHCMKRDILPGVADIGIRIRR